MLSMFSTMWTRRTETMPILVLVVVHLGRRFLESMQKYFNQMIMCHFSVVNRGHERYSTSKSLEM